MTVTLLFKKPNFNKLNVQHTQKDSALLISPPLDSQKGPFFGDIFICEDHLCFYSESSATGIVVPYSDIVIHAASRQEGQPNIYCQLTSGVFFSNQTVAENQSATELRLIPRDSNSVEKIYMVMSDCVEKLFERTQESEEEPSVSLSDNAELEELQQAAFKHLETVFEPK
ncbi:regulator of volume decrease after cellular swelling-domain-containing protein [Sporodiniella umbellata]|nr:regulator of volume decrease after cellular swelling-domain-containing protein [Sporodiniella umbellata]